jgi:hypothetical protein
MKYLIVLGTLVCAIHIAAAQQNMPMKPADSSMNMTPGMAMQSGDPLMQQMHPETFLQQILHHAASGTSAEPDSTPAPMLMNHARPVDVDVPC